MKNQKGFTLIELVMVILLLGILAAVAIPRFWDLGTEADQAAGDGGIAGIKSGIAIYNASRRLSGASTLYPGNPLSSDVVSDIYSAAGPASTVCAAFLPGVWTVNSTTDATVINYRWRSATKFSSWSYTSASGIVGNLPVEGTCT